MSKEQTALERIKNEVAKENNYLDWDDLYVSNLSIVLNDEYWPIVCERFASQAVEDYKEKLKYELRKFATTNGIMYVPVRLEVQHLLKLIDSIK